MEWSGDSEQSWDIVDAVARSPLLQQAKVPQGLELAEVERMLLSADDVEPVEREWLLAAVRELAAFAQTH